MGTNRISVDVPLTNSELYSTAIGACLAYDMYETENIIYDKSNRFENNEIARVFINPTNKERYILYFPGKDNDNPPSEESETAPLKSIVEKVDALLLQEYQDITIKQAKKIFIIETHQLNSGYPVKHYIFATLENGELIIEDSMTNYSYPTRYICRLLKPKRYQIIYQGWQTLNALWQSGHYVIQGIMRHIYGFEIPSELFINDEIVSKHNDWYLQNKPRHKGKRRLPRIDNSDEDIFHTISLIDENDTDTKKNKGTKSEAYNFTKQDTPLIHLTGKLITPDNSKISADETLLALNKLFGGGCKIQSVEDTENDNTCLHLISINNIVVLDKLGIKPQQTDKGLHYSLIIKKQCELATAPLMGLTLLSPDNKHHCIDLTSHLSLNTVKAITENIANNSSPTHLRAHAEPESILAEVNKVNAYLSQRAKETSGPLSFFLDEYSGFDYYQRRESWEKILNKLNQHILDKTQLTKDQLVNYILQEAAKFKGHSVRSDYSNCLIKLAAELSKNQTAFEANNAFHKQLHGYIQLYQAMENFRQKISSSPNRHSLFGASKKKDSCRNSDLYAAMLKIFPGTENFLSLENERKMERWNQLHF